MGARVWTSDTRFVYTVLNTQLERSLLLFSFSLRPNANITVRKLQLILLLKVTTQIHTTFRTNTRTKCRSEPNVRHTLAQTDKIAKIYVKLLYKFDASFLFIFSLSLAAYTLRCNVP